MHYYTADPVLDAARWESDQDDVAAEIEQSKRDMQHHYTESFIEGLQWGESHRLDLPGLPSRTTHEAVGELLDKNSQIVTQALCLLAQLKDAGAQRMVRALAEAWAEGAAEE